MIDQVLLCDCRQLAFDIAPELESQPLYVVDESLFAGLPMTTDCLAWANDGRFTMLVYEERLRDADLWEGPGPIIAFRTTAILEQYKGDLRAGVLDTMPHEVAHILPPKKARAAADLGWEPADLPKVRDIEMKGLERPTPDEFVRESHDATFCRLALHCWSRAVSSGWSVSPYGLFAGSDIWPIQTPHYVVALMPELIGLRGASFDEIAAIAPPQAFTELFETEPR